MFGMWEAIYAYLSRMVGNRTDAADAAGSLHAKVKDVKDSVYARVDLKSLDAKISNAFKYEWQNNSTNATVTVLDVTGSGYLTGINQYLYMSSNSTGDFFGGLKIIVDGVTILDDPNFCRSRYTGTDHNYIVPGTLPCMLRFKTSLTIQVTRPSGNGLNFFCKGTYMLD